MISLIRLNPISTRHEDLKYIMDLRNNPEVMKGFYTQGYADPHLLTWKEHIKWWRTRPSSWREFLIEDNGQHVGVVTLGQCEYWEPEIGIMIEPAHWGKGYAKQAIQLAFKYLIACGKKYTRTTILDNNERSIRLFTSLGYMRVGDARPGESLYRKTL